MSASETQVLPRGAAGAAAVGTRFGRLWQALGRLEARLPIATKVALALVIVGAATIGFLAWYVHRSDSREAIAELEEQAFVLAGSVQNVVDSQREDERGYALEEIQAYIDALLAAEPSLMMIDVVGTRDGRPALLASTEHAHIGISGGVLDEAFEDYEELYSADSIGNIEHGIALGNEPVIEVTVPLGIPGMPAAAVSLYLSTDEARGAVAAQVRTFLIGAGGVLALAALVLFFGFRFLVFGRLRRLLAATEQMRAGDYAARVEGLPDTDPGDEALRLSLRFNAMAASIQTLHAQLQEQATTDPLTGLWNRRYAIEALEREILRARRQSEPLAVVLLDLDNLKEINDQHGHALGDAALQCAGEALRGALRATDIPARFGGDEFIAVLPDCDANSLATVMERTRTGLEDLWDGRRARGVEAAVTVSAGGATLKPYENADGLIHRADLALYEAKRSGRNQARVAA